MLPHDLVYTCVGCGRTWNTKSPCLTPICQFQSMVIIYPTPSLVDIINALLAFPYLIFLCQNILIVSPINFFAICIGFVHITYAAIRVSKWCYRKFNKHETPIP